MTFAFARSAFVALSLLTAPFAYAHGDDDHSHDMPDFVYTEAPMDRVMGSADADHTLILYASNVCPHCGSWFANDWPAVKSELIETGELRFVFRPLPSQPMQLSLTGFIMAECAPEGRYMAVIEDQFARQNAILSAQDGVTIKAEYDAIAQTAGLMDEPAITACLSDQSKTQALQLSRDRASAAGVAGIPAFIFDGQLMTGDHDVKAIRGWMDGRSSSR